MNDLINSWIRYHQNQHPKDNDPDFEAYIKLDDYVRNDPDKALAIMDGIVAATDDEKVLGNLGAGPLEDLLGSPKGTDYVQEIIDRARKDRKWRLAFGCVWTTSFKDKEVAAKIEEVVAKFFPEGRP